MSYFSWQDKFSVGVEALDREHKILIDLIDRLHEALVNKTVLETLPHIVSTLMAYSRDHFAHEEEALEKYDYPTDALEAHKKAHEDLRAETREMKRRLDAGEHVNIGLDFLCFLHNWLYFHILEEDMAYCDFLRDKEVL